MLFIAAFADIWAHSMGPQRSPLSRVVVVVDIDFTLPFTKCRYCRTPPVL